MFKAQRILFCDVLKLFKDLKKFDRVLAVNYCYNQKLKPPDQPSDLEKPKEDVKQFGQPKSLRIAILGMPNAGKSTLVNQLIRRQVCAASSRVHTTRVQSKGVYTEDDTQLIFLDTPGLVTRHQFKKYNLEESFRNDCVDALHKADVLGIIHDVSDIHTREYLHHCILDVAKDMEGKDMILIMNKVDRIKNKARLLPLVKKITENRDYPKFAEVFLISATSGDGVDDIRDYFLDMAKVDDWEFEPGVPTDQPPEEIIERMVRAKLLDNTPDEVGYTIKIELEHFNVNPDESISANVLLRSDKERNFSEMMGPKARNLVYIGKQTQQALRNAFRKEVHIRLHGLYVPKAKK